MAAFLILQDVLDISVFAERLKLLRSARAHRTISLG